MALDLTQRKRLLVAIALSALVGMIAAAVNSGMLGLFPPKLTHSNLQISAAATHVLVDSSPSIVQRPAAPQDLDTLVKRAELLGRVLVSPVVLDRVAKLSSIPPDQLGGLARTTASVPAALTEPDSERRASEIAQSTLPYKIEVQARPTTPILDIFTQAPSTDEAQRIADKAVVALDDYVRALAAQQGVPDRRLASLRPLGSARGAVVNARASKAIGALTFMVAFALSMCAYLGVRRLRRRGSRRPSRPTTPTQTATATATAGLPRGACTTPSSTTGRIRRACCRGCSPASSRSCGWSRSTRSS